MIRAGAALIGAAALTILAAASPAAADPAGPADPAAEPHPVSYLIGRCYDPSQPVEERPERILSNCEGTGRMRELTWTQWDAESARGTVIAESDECKPNR